MSPRSLSWIHTAVVGFALGSLTYLSQFVTGASIPPLRAVVAGIVSGGISKMAGALIGRITAEEATPKP